MLRRILIFMAAMASTFTLVAATTAADSYAKPDFAFPTKVASGARTMLDKAIAADNGPLALRALMNLSMALTEIDPDSASTVLADCRRTSRTLTRPADKALVDLLTAKMYFALYQRNRWNYDRCEQPAADTSDYKLWSGTQWRDTITALVDSAMERPDALAATSLSAYAKVISVDRRIADMYPTVLDFVASQATSLLPQLGETDMLPLRLLCPWGDFLAMHVTVQKPLARRVLDIYSTWIDHARTRPAALIAADLSRLEFVNDNLFSRGEQMEQTRTRMFDALYSLWQTHKASPYAAEILIKADGTVSNDEAPLPIIKKFIAACEEQIAAHPRYFRNGWLQRDMAWMKQPAVTVRYPSTVMPGDSLQLNLRVRNARDFSVNVYSAPYKWGEWSWGYEVTKKNIPQLRLVKSVRVTCDSVAPFRTDITRKVVLDTPGTYIVAAVFPEQTIDTGNYVYVHCSALRLGSLSFKGEAWPFVVNPATGRPVEGATLKGYGYENRQRKFSLIDTKTTDADGMAQINPKARTIFAQKGTDRFAESVGMNNYYNDPSRAYSVQGFTSLALYHPGDTVEWAAIAQSFLQQASKPMPDTEMRVVMYDANMQPVDTATVTTDLFGRAEGSFNIPKEGLTGNYSLRFTLTDDAIAKKQRWSNVYFTVSDYKLPTYMIEVTDVERDTPEKGDVTVKGRAVTYSGFPVADATVSVNLSAGGRAWWNTPVSFASLPDTTDAEGRFTIICTDALLSGAPVDKGVFTADITVTSPSGENRTASTAFTLGKQLLLNAALANLNVDADKPLRLNLDLTTVNGVKRDATITYEFLRADSTVAARGTFESAKPEIDVTALKSGVYSLRVATADTTLADPATIADVVLYRPSDTASPVADLLLWLPATSATIPATGGIDQLYATTAPETWILYILTAGDRVIDKGWITVGPGMHRFTRDLPADTPTATLIMATARGYKYDELQVNYTRDNVISSLDIAIESFRDRIAPGDTERWTLRVTGGKDSSPQRAALMLDIYNKALDAITPQRFSLYPQRSPYPVPSMNINNGLGWHDNSRSLPVKRFTCPSMPTLSYITWGRPLIGEGVVRMLRSRIYGATSVYAKDEVKEEEVINTMATTNRVFNAVEQAPMMAAGTDDKNVVREHKKSIEVEEAVSEDSADMDGGAPAARKESDEFAYRDAETPLALFAPMLTTEADGSLRIDFTAPNANATWALKAIAYNADMIAGTAAREMIASKPVMVQPNLPRFLRNGDKAVVKATVMNNADSASTVAVSVEIFDPATGEVLDSRDYTVDVAPQGSTIISTDIDAPADALMLGYRVKASAGRYADGEQTVIPVLPASQPVVESTPFYIPADTLDWAVKLPKMGKEARVTLQFCENPAWYVATALPRIRAGESRDALSASAAIFSAAVADGLLRDQPAIAEALRQWSHSDRSDSTLTSMLERNADLKIVLLNATPWMMDARSQTERMERLSLLFDPKEISSTYTASIALLKKLQCDDGGLAWTPLYMQSSLWATENALLTFGRLRQLGWLPDNKDLSAIIDKALAYTDSTVAAYARKHRDSTDETYVYIRALYPDTERPGECTALTSRTVASLLKSWRDMPAGSKAIAALIFKAQGQTEAARLAVASLRDFAVTTPERGMWWPSLDTQSWWSMGRIGTTALILDAFAAVDPSSPDIDLIRQWMIIQKEATDWGTSVVTSQVIASILRTGTKWTRPASPVVIKVGKEKVMPDRIESLLGEMRTDITSLRPSGKTLAIGKSQAGPSWGAVISRYTGVMTDIKAASCDDLSIEKAIYKRVPTPDGEKWVDADTLRTGDVIQVNLTIVAARDIDYAAIVDNRAACLEPVDQLPTPIWSEGLCFYRENRDAATNIFITRLPKGTYRLSYLLNVNNAGTFSSGIATIQSQYAPSLTAHSSGTLLHINQ
ncbi:alpha-2-macroglobulin family protein [uncultured Muribaculum sp.]|uniref:alpha-2-macroglobulin family protein n=1 Tax=uncultured Muribaculum sp. TaxID=1918613 RepID=UPI0025D910E1|nr:alpha-2-macroglobulin family protein [uncultured Muribaculum sp.]